MGTYRDIYIYIYTYTYTYMVYSGHGKEDGSYYLGIMVQGLRFGLKWLSSFSKWV